MTKRKDMSEEDYKKQKSIYNKAYRKKNRKKLIKASKEYYKTHKKEMNKRSAKWNKSPEGKAYQKAYAHEYNTSKEGRKYHLEYGKEWSWIPENRIRLRKNDIKAKRIKRQLIFKIVARAHSKTVACFCCGVTDSERSNTLELEHRFPRYIFRILFPEYAITEIGSNQTYEEWCMLSKTNLLNVNAMKTLTLAEVKRHFAILCGTCNTQVFSKGTCYLGRKQGHKYWKKSSKYLDKKYLSNIEFKTYRQPGPDWRALRKIDEIFRNHLL